MKKVILIALTLSITAPFLSAELNKSVTFGAEVYDAEGQATKAEALSAKIYGIYFSAHWCPPCRAFSPELVDVYKKINRKSLEEGIKNFEIIFVSSDRTEQAQFEYMEELEMPWYTIKLGQKQAKALTKKYSVRGIPTLVIIDAEGNLITKNGREDVTELGKKALQKWIGKD
jgi:nucleoredoxin